MKNVGPEECPRGERDRLGTHLLSLPFPSCVPWRGYPLPLLLSVLICRLGVMRVKEACGWPRACFFLHCGTRGVMPGMGGGVPVCSDVPPKCPLPRTASLLRELFHISTNYPLTACSPLGPACFLPPAFCLLLGQEMASNWKSLCQPGRTPLLLGEAVWVGGWPCLALAGHFQLSQGQQRRFWLRLSY